MRLLLVFSRLDLCHMPFSMATLIWETYVQHLKILCQVYYLKVVFSMFSKISTFLPVEFLFFNSHFSKHIQFSHYFKQFFFKLINFWSAQTERIFTTLYKKRKRFYQNPNPNSKPCMIRGQCMVPVPSKIFLF